MQQTLTFRGQSFTFYAIGGALPTAPVVLRPENGKWYIELGFAGFNSPANNRGGYKSEAAACAAILRYQGRSKR